MLSPLAFMKARLIRLYPMYLLGLAIGLALSGARRPARLAAGAAGRSSASSPLFGLAFLPAPPHVELGLAGHLYPLNAPAWSLFFELVANLVYALVARFL